MDLQKLTLSACDLVRTVGQFIHSELGNVGDGEIETKSMNSLVSYVDKEAEKQLVAGLSTILPSAVFLTEEDTVEDNEGEHRWIIDPLDGTTNFLHHLPVFAVSVGLEVKGELVAGIVLEVNRQECFYAWKGGGAWLDGTRIHVSKTEKLEDALIATGFPYHDYNKLDAYLKALSMFMKGTRGIRRLGAAAVDLAYVAAGRFDAFFEYSLNPWDVAGGAVLVREAGGIIADFDGGDGYLHGREIIVANPRVYKEVLEVIKYGF